MDGVLGRIYPYQGVSPRIGADVFVAPSAVVAGDVELGDGVSIWYQVTARGDVHYIRIGPRTNIQDGAVLHVTHDTHPLIVGSEVTVGHAAVLHGCTVEDRCLIGIGATVLDGAVVETESMVAAGTLVPPGFRVPRGMLVMGVPAKVARPLTDGEIADLSASAARYVEYARLTLVSLSGGAIP